MAEHTPGPWDIVIRSNDDYGMWAGLTHIATVHNREDSPVDEANARLIAAAPALLEALELASKYLGKAVADGLMGGTAVPVERAFEITKAVIAQARGEPARA